MRIAFVITRGDSVGGAQIHVRDLSSALLHFGHEVKVFYGGQGAFSHLLSGASIPALSLQYLQRPILPWIEVLAFFELQKALRDFSPDLIVTHSSKAGWLGRLVAWRLGLPVVFTAHGWAFAEGVAGNRRWVYRLAERLAALLATRIIAVSEEGRRLAMQERVAKDEKIIVIHNGISDIAAQYRADPHRNPVKIIMVARFQTPKDHAGALEALARMTDLDWRLDFIGDGPLRAQVQRLADALNISDRVEFLGERDEVKANLAQSQIFLLISKSEGFPYSILEAMRAGLPVVASSVGGIPEAVVEGRTGYLIPSGRVDVLESRLRELVVDSELRVRMGSAGRRRYLENFTLEMMLLRTLEVYRDSSPEMGFCLLQSE
jgi:glycosyltransferase involved in cell wall biosynthesis